MSAEALEELRSTSLARFNGVATSSVTAIGGLLVAVLGVAAPGPVLGVGAAALALPAVVIGAPLAAIGGFLATRRYRRLARATREEFDAQIRHMQVSLRDAMQEMTQQERNRLTQYGQQVLVPVYSRLDMLGNRDLDRSDVLQGHLDAIARLRATLEQG